ARPAADRRARLAARGERGARGERARPRRARHRHPLLLPAPPRALTGPARPARCRCPRTLVGSESMSQRESAGGPEGGHMGASVSEMARDIVVALIQTGKIQLYADPKKQ